MIYSIDSRGWNTHTAWCVPTVISFLCNIPLIHSHSRAACIRNETLKTVSGVHATEALLMLREQGKKGIQIDLKTKYVDAPKLKTFLKNRSSYETCMPLMIQIEDNSDFCHMICAHYGFAADNHTMKPVPIHEFPHLNKYVTSAWIVETL